MGWHDCRIYRVEFPIVENNLALRFDIDYLFEWVLDEGTGFYKFWRSPCELTFMGVLELKIDLDFQEHVGIDVQEISRSKVENATASYWKYMISTDHGEISFVCDGIEQLVLEQPVFSDSQTRVASL